MLRLLLEQSHRLALRLGTNFPEELPTLSPPLPPGDLLQAPSVQERPLFDPVLVEVVVLVDHLLIWKECLEVEKPV